MVADDVAADHKQSHTPSSSPWYPCNSSSVGGPTVILVTVDNKYVIQYSPQLLPSSGSFFRSHSDCQLFLTTNMQHLSAPKNGEFLIFVW